MAISPIYKGSTHLALALTMRDDAGNVVPLTGGTPPVLSVMILSITTGVRRSGDGTVTITNGALGQFNYQFSTTDVGTIGDYQYQFNATFSDGTILRADPIDIAILDPI